MPIRTRATSFHRGVSSLDGRNSESVGQASATRMSPGGSPFPKGDCPVLIQSMPRPVSRSDFVRIQPGRFGTGDDFVSGWALTNAPGTACARRPRFFPFGAPACPSDPRFPMYNGPVFRTEPAFLVRFRCERMKAAVNTRLVTEKNQRRTGMVRCRFFDRAHAVVAVVFSFGAGS